MKSTKKKLLLCREETLAKLKLYLKGKENILYMVDETSEEAVKADYASSHLIALHSKFLVWKTSSFEGG
jgi:hypothetical protein